MDEYTKEKIYKLNKIMHENSDKEKNELLYKLAELMTTSISEFLFLMEQLKKQNRDLADHVFKSVIASLINGHCNDMDQSMEFAKDIVKMMERMDKKLNEVDR